MKSLPCWCWWIHVRHGINIMILSNMSCNVSLIFSKKRMFRSKSSTQTLGQRINHGSWLIIYVMKLSWGEMISTQTMYDTLRVRERINFGIHLWRWMPENAREREGSLHAGHSTEWPSVDFLLFSFKIEWGTRFVFAERRYCTLYTLRTRTGTVCLGVNWLNGPSVQQSSMSYTFFARSP